MLYLCEVDSISNSAVKIHVPETTYTGADNRWVNGVLQRQWQAYSDQGTQTRKPIDLVTCAALCTVDYWNCDASTVNLTLTHLTVN